MHHPLTRTDQVHRGEFHGEGVHGLRLVDDRQRVNGASRAIGGEDSIASLETT
jgi:hypothetical protein